MADGQTDDGKRGRSAVGVSVRLEEGGLARVIVDDLMRQESARYPDWSTHVFVTWATLREEELVNMEFSDEQALALGQTILARLAAQLRTRQES